MDILHKLFTVADHYNVGPHFPLRFSHHYYNMRSPTYDFLSLPINTWFNLTRLTPICLFTVAVCS